MIEVVVDRDVAHQNHNRKRAKGRNATFAAFGPPDSAPNMRTYVR